MATKKDMRREELSTHASKRKPSNENTTPND